MEGAGFIRSHSEKVVLRNNIFSESDEPRAAGEAGEDGPDDQDVDDEVILKNELRARAKVDQAARPAAHDAYDE